MMMNTNKKITASLFVLVLVLAVVGTTSICAVTTYPAPQLQSPQNGVIVTIGPITLSWNAVPEANYYMLVKSSNQVDWANFSVSQPSSIYATSWTLSADDLYDHVYSFDKQDTFYWKVTAVCGPYLAFSPDSSIWSFHVLKTPPAFIDVNYWNGMTSADPATYAWGEAAFWELINSMASNPLGGWGSPNLQYWGSSYTAVTTLHSFPLVWSDRSDDSQLTPVAFADFYRIQISTSSTFSSTIADTTTENVSYTTPDLSPGVYYWRVRSETNDDLVTDWNATRKFIIASGPTGTMGVSVSISPNSQSGANGATLTYTVTVNNTGNASDNYSLTVTDDAGWFPSVLPTLLNMTSGSIVASLSVTIPSGAVEGTIDSITVTATSQTNSTVENSATCTATAAAGGGATGGGTSPFVYVGVVVVIVAILGAVLVVIKPF
jgi:uncharacterized repeat protein (TIGR01451 family)